MNKYTFFFEPQGFDRIAFDNTEEGAKLQIFESLTFLEKCQTESYDCVEIIENEGPDNWSES